MNKYLKYSILGVLLILVLNLLTWFFYGKETVVLKGAEIEELYAYINKPDTLYLFVGKVNDEYSYRYSDYKYKTIEKLAANLSSQDIVTIIDSRPFPLESSDSESIEFLESKSSNTYAYDVSIHIKFPLFTEVYRIIWVPGFATDDGAIYLWFFGWHQLWHTGVGVT